MMRIGSGRVNGSARQIRRVSALAVLAFLPATAGLADGTGFVGVELRYGEMFGSGVTESEADNYLIPSFDIS